MEVCLKVLRMLSEINAVHEIVPYNTFYIHELADQLDLEEDYRNWKEGRDVSLGVEGGERCEFGEGMEVGNDVGFHEGM